MSDDRNVGDDHVFEFGLFRASRSVRRAFDARLAPLGLNFTEASLLSHLREAGPVTQRGVADHLSIGKASTGSFIDGLERRGLVRRAADSADRRVWRIALTEHGEALLRRLDYAEAGLRADLRVGISEDDRTLLIDLLERLLDNAAKLAGLPDE